MDPVLDPILPETFLGYSRESNPGPLGWQSDIPYVTTGNIIVSKLFIQTF